jgi:putative ABC transport system permease protein
MNVLLKIALRNILANHRRSLLIGLAIFISTFLLLSSNSIMNGVARQTLRGYINIQTGHVAVMWEKLHRTDPNDLSRFINLFETNSFEVEKAALNQKSLDGLARFLREHHSQIKAFHPIIRRNAELISDRKVDSLLIYGLTAADRDLFLSTGTITLKEGKLTADQNYGICISREKAEADRLRLGDSVTIEVTTPYGAQNSLDFVVSGIYTNAAGYDNWYGFVSDANARELFDFDRGYFDFGKVFLKDPSRAEDFAKRLDAYLLTRGAALRSESYLRASPMYTNISRNMKTLFNVFICFLLAMISMGLRSTVRMNLFERMKEFGTIRAIGYSRRQTYAVIFLETFLLALFALGAALILTVILTLIFANTGVYVGTGPISMALGGESFYPRMEVADVLTALAVMLIFTLISTLKPGLRLCYQAITDILAKRQRPVSPVQIWLKTWLTRLNDKSAPSTGKTYH